MADTTHWSATPNDACLAILSGLSALQYEDGGAGGSGSGCVKSIARIAHDSDLEQIKLGLHAGMPGILLFYGAGAAPPGGADQRRFRHEMMFRLLCCSDRFLSRVTRQSGAGEMDMDAAVNPGVEELQDWGMYLALRALADTTGVCKPYCQRMSPAQIVRPGLYIGTVDLVATREIDIYDDEISTVLSTLGIVHTTDGTIAWDDSPTDTDPDSDWPGSLGGGAPYDPDL